MIRIDKNLNLEVGADTRIQLRARDAIKLGEKLITNGVRRMARDEYEHERRGCKSR